MNTSSTHRPLHPMIWVAAVSVTLLSIAGIAAITGLIPTSMSAESPAIPQPVTRVATPAPAPSVVPEPAAVPAPVVATPAVAPQARAPKVVAKADAVKHRHVEPRIEPIARTEPIPQPTPSLVPPPPPAVCKDCGHIESVQQINHEGDGSGVGAVAGGVLGGVVGNNVGRGSGRTLATIAGVVGGALIGNNIEKSQKKSVSYQTVVRFDDGTSQVFNSDTAPGWLIGAKVRVVNGSIQPD